MAATDEDCLAASAESDRKVENQDGQTLLGQEYSSREEVDNSPRSGETVVTQLPLGTLTDSASENDIQLSGDLFSESEWVPETQSQNITSSLDSTPPRFNGKEGNKGTVTTATKEAGNRPGRSMTEAKKTTKQMQKTMSTVTTERTSANKKPGLVKKK